MAMKRQIYIKKRMIEVCLCLFIDESADFEMTQERRNLLIGTEST